MAFGAVGDPAMTQMNGMMLNYELTNIFKRN